MENVCVEPEKLLCLRSSTADTRYRRHKPCMVSPGKTTCSTTLGFVKFTCASTGVLSNLDIGNESGSTSVKQQIAQARVPIYSYLISSHDRFSRLSQKYPGGGGGSGLP